MNILVYNHEQVTKIVGESAIDKINLFQNPAPFIWIHIFQVENQMGNKWSLWTFFIVYIIV